MSVGNELSSDVASALLQTEGAINARELKNVLTLIRSALRALSEDEKRRRRAKLLFRYPHGLSGSASGRAN